MHPVGTAIQTDVHWLPKAKQLLIVQGKKGKKKRMKEEENERNQKKRTEVRDGKALPNST